MLQLFNNHSVTGAFTLLAHLSSVACVNHFQIYSRIYFSMDCKTTGSCITLFLLLQQGFNKQTTDFHICVINKKRLSQLRNIYSILDFIWIKCFVHFKLRFFYFFHISVKKKLSITEMNLHSLSLLHKRSCLVSFTIIHLH